MLWNYYRFPAVDVVYMQDSIGNFKANIRTIPSLQDLCIDPFGHGARRSVEPGATRWLDG